MCLDPKSPSQLILLLALAGIPLLAQAAVYRCENGGVIAYQDSPCSSARQPPVSAPNGIPSSESAAPPGYSGIMKEAVLRGFKEQCMQKYRQHGANQAMAESACECQAGVMGRNYTTREFADIAERGPQALAGSEKTKRVGIQLMRCEP